MIEEAKENKFKELREDIYSPDVTRFLDGY